MRMQQRINRSQRSSEKGRSQHDGQSTLGPQSPGGNKSIEMEEGGDVIDKDNPIVALEPEDNLR